MRRTKTGLSGRKQKGFVLIELLVVTSIISLLASTVTAITASARPKGRDAVRLRTFNTLSTALELYLDTYGVYPCGDANRPGGGTRDSAFSSGFLNGGAGGCVGTPTTGLQAAGLMSNPWIRDPINAVPYGYVYDVLADRQSYILYTRLEKNPTLSANDGGLCSGIYEFGTGVGTITPSASDTHLGGCNTP